jgi:tetratricopeptide (TPR) repeat protein
MIGWMVRVLPFLLAAACAATPRSTYVPGGGELPGEARALYGRAVDRELAGRTEDALALFDELCSRYPLQLAFHLRRLRLARVLEGAEYAAGLYDPAPPGVDAQRADILAALARAPENDVSARRGVLEFAAEREPDEPLWLLGLVDVDLAAYDETVRRGARERELGRIDVAKATAEEARVVLDRARAEASRALELTPELAEAQLLLGYLATREADAAPDVDTQDALRERAQGYFERAVAIDPACLAGYVNLAENHLHFDRFTEAGKALREAAAIAPVEPLVWNNLGYTYYATGRLDDAVVAYRTALELEPRAARVRTALSDCLRRQGDAKAATRELERARADVGEDRALRAEIAFKLAAIHEHEGRYREAVREYERHIELGGADSAKARSRVRHIFEGAG